jgi:acetate kinase
MQDVRAQILEFLPESAYYYAIPLELAEKHHIRRYGFHGLAHRYMMDATVLLQALRYKKRSL